MMDKSSDASHSARVGRGGGAHRAKSRFHPFRTAAASRTMSANSFRSTRSSVGVARSCANAAPSAGHPASRVARSTICMCASHA
jgi:hypothetical protein